MSADNWAICPKCKAEKDESDEQVKNAYGVVPADEYMYLVELSKKKLENTLREDYEIGIYDGNEFYINYTGRCSVCGFEKRFKHTEKLEGIN